MDAHAHRRGVALATREAIVLPLLLLTVALGGGFRMMGTAGQLVFLPPSLMSLVLGLLLMAALFRARVLQPERLMQASRPPLANLSGAIVLFALFAASAQVFNTTTPEAGLLQLTFNVFYVLLLANTLAARPDRARLLSSLMIVLGSAFVMKYVVLAALYDQHGGITRRVLMALLEGVTLGGLAFDTPAPATGYVAFFTLLCYLAALILLPSADAARLDPASAALTRRGPDTPLVTEARHADASLPLPLPEAGAGAGTRRDPDDR